jgi:ABC-type glycerol-3-phosphate transport system substrate-binding protein
MRARPLLSLCLLLAVACSPVPTPPPSPAGEVAPAASPASAPTPPASDDTGGTEVVTIGFGGAEFERPIYEPLIAEFNRQNPGISVRFVPLDGIRQALAGGMTNEQMDAVVAQWLGRIVRAVDTASLYGLNREEMQSGLLADLTPFAQADPGDQQSDTLIAAGRAGMWLDFGIALSRGSGSVQLAPPPLGARPLATEDVTVRALYIAAQTPHAAACWQWMRALSADATGLAGAIPACIETIGVDTIAREGAPGAGDVYAAYREALARPGGEARAPLLGGDVEPFWFFRAADRALQGADLERELAEAQTLTAQHLACVRAGDRPGDCARQIDPSYDGWN